MSIGGIVAALAAGMVWRRRSTVGARALFALGLFASLWGLFYALELSSAAAGRAILFAKAQYIGIAAVPIAWLSFALAYTGRDRWLKGWRVVLLAALPTITLLLALTNEQHRLLWSSVEPLSLNGLMMLDYGHGPWFWVYIVYSYLCLAAGSALLLFGLRHSLHIYWPRVVALLVGIFTPWVGNAIYISGLSPWPGLDLTPLAFSISSLAIALSILRFRLFDIVPVARGLVLEQLSERVVVVDSENNVVDINRAALEALDVSAGRAIGRRVEELFARWEEQIGHYNAREQMDEEVVIDSSGVRSWYEVRITPLYSRAGRLRGRVIIWRDITERKLAEAALVAAKEAAEAASRTKSAFLANMSHELRTPLTSIQGFAQLIEIQLQHGDAASVGADVAAIRQSGDHLLAMINSLLDLSRIEAGVVQLSWEDVDLRAAIMEAVQASKPMILRNANTLQLELAPDLGQIQTDRLKLRQVLLNLLGNAAKFTSQGVIRVCAARVRPADGEEEVRISVGDTGVGIAPEELPHLFVTFAEADPEKRRRYGGTGIGLAISRHYCRLMGGDLTVESQPGQGATFTISLQARARHPGTELAADLSSLS